MGIAYAEFETTEIASKVVADLHGAIFFNRNLSMKIHFPYVPKIPFTTSFLTRKFSYHKNTNKPNQDPQIKLEKSNDPLDPNNGLNNQSISSTPVFQPEFAATLNDEKGDSSGSGSGNNSVNGNVNGVADVDTDGIGNHSKPHVKKLTIKKINKRITTWDLEKLLNHVKPTSITIIPEKKFKFNSNYVSAQISFEKEPKSELELIRLIGEIQFLGKKLHIEPCLSTTPNNSPSVSKTTGAGFETVNNSISGTNGTERTLKIVYQFDEHPLSGKKIRILKRPKTKVLQAKVSNPFFDSSIVNDSDTFDDLENFQLNSELKDLETNILNESVDSLIIDGSDNFNDSESLELRPKTN